MEIRKYFGNRKVLLVLSAIFIIGLIVFTSGNNSERQEVTVLTEEDSVNVSVEIADSKSEREQGLMYRRKLALGEGMLFVFEEEAPRSFWMKNTYIPLDIVFLDSDGRVLNVEEAYPEPDVSEEELEHYTSDGDAQFVLELNSTFSEKYGVNTNDRVKFYEAVK